MISNERNVPKPKLSISSNMMITIMTSVYQVSICCLSLSTALPPCDNSGISFTTAL